MDCGTPCRDMSVHRNALISKTKLPKRTNLHQRKITSECSILLSSTLLFSTLSSDLISLARKPTAIWCLSSCRPVALKHVGTTLRIYANCTMNSTVVAFSCSCRCCQVSVLVTHSRLPAFQHLQLSSARNHCSSVTLLRSGTVVTAVVSRSSLQRYS